VVFSVAVLAVPVAMRRTRTRLWRHTVQPVGRVHGRITPEGIEWNTDRSTTRWEWARFVEVQRVGDLASASCAPRSAFYFPRSSFESDGRWTAFDTAIAACAAR